MHISGDDEKKKKEINNKKKHYLTLDVIKKIKKSWHWIQYRIINEEGE